MENIKIYGKDSRQNIMKKIKYSIVMPCLLNRPEHKSVVEDCIATVKEHTNWDEAEFIIVDDGSKLPTGFLKEEADTYIRHNPTNKGISPSWNDGINVARGEYIIVINDDIRVKKGWLEGLVKAFEYKYTGVAGPAVEHITSPGSGVGENHKWFPGYCFMLSRNVIEKLREIERKKTKEQYPGLFDENFVPFNAEDVDYWHRLRNQGFKLMRVWDVVIWHAEGDTIHHLDTDYEKRSQEANEQFNKKWGFNPIIEYYD